MPFQNQKKTFLRKKDKSKIGKVDKNIRKLVSIINKNPNYYTTSSCAGRIVLLKQKSSKKDETEWIFSSHEKVKFADLKKALNKPPKEQVWFKQEGVILHIRCKTIDDAKKLLNSVRTAGFKRAGICSFTKKIMVEIIDTERIDLPVAEKGKLLVDKSYLKFLVGEANSKLKRTIKKIKKLEKKLKKI